MTARVRARSGHLIYHSQYATDLLEFPMHFYMLNYSKSTEKAYGISKWVCGLSSWDKINSEDAFTVAVIQSLDVVQLFASSRGLNGL